MRYLTIKRNKTFVGCAMKLKVYIEDQFEGDTVIGNCPCKKIGDIKNGEEKTFPIGNGEAKVFVIGDKLSKSYVSEFFRIPAGLENVYLSGKNHYNPFAGNPFRFDGNDTPEVLEHRKKTKKKAYIIMALACVVGLLIGFFGPALLSPEVKDDDPRAFYCEEMSIVLTKGFTDSYMEGYSGCFDSETAAVFVTREEFSLMEGLKDYTLDEYGKLVLDSNKDLFPEGTEIKTEDGLTYYEHSYFDEEAEEGYNYFGVLLKSDEAFWVVEFACSDYDYEVYRPYFVKWAKTIEFDENVSGNNAV